MTFNKRRFFTNLALQGLLATSYFAAGFSYALVGEGYPPTLTTIGIKLGLIEAKPFIEPVRTNTPTTKPTPMTQQ